jgi:uncharacterized protein YktB (UPF0637 family)
MATRAEQFHRREKALREIVADYFDASEQADKPRTGAQHKVEKVHSQAEERIAAIRKQADTDIGEHERRADAAVGRMLELGETPKAVADTLDIPLTRVREIQRHTPQPRETTRNTQ